MSRHGLNHGHAKSGSGARLVATEPTSAEYIAGRLLEEERERRDAQIVPPKKISLGGPAWSRP